jgi:hypothetical protein
MLTHIFIILFLLVILLIPSTTTLAQQASMVWDEKTKTWISTPTAPATPTITTQQPQPQTTTIPPQQTVTTIPVTAGASTVDLGTLMTVITPILAGIAGIFVKNRKDMEKKDEEVNKKVEKTAEEVKKQTIEEIKSAILPTLKQITPVAEATAKQDVKINQLAEELYKLMAEKANEIHDKPEIQQQKLIEDAVRSKIVAEQTKEPSMKWDDKTKSWISK